MIDRLDSVSLHAAPPIVIEAESARLYEMLSGPDPFTGPLPPTPPLDLEALLAEAVASADATGPLPALPLATDCTEATLALDNVGMLDLTEPFLFGETMSASDASPLSTWPPEAWSDSSLAL